MDEEEKKNNIGTPKHNSLINSTGKHTSVTHNGAKHNSPMIINNGVIISHNDYGSIVTGRRSPKDYINGEENNPFILIYMNYIVSESMA